MMKKFRNIRILLPVLCLIWGLTACKSSKDPESKDTEVQQTQTGKPGAAGQENSEPQVPSQEAAVPETEENEPPQSEQAGEQEPEAGESQAAGKDTLVVYFSATGTTKGVAEKIAALTDADLYEIVPAQIYSAEDLDYRDDNSRSTLEMDDPDARPEIGSEPVSLEGYSRVYLGYPIWWGDAPRIMSTFVESQDFTGITVIPFCTSGGSGIGRSGENLAAQAGSGTWLSGERLNGSVSESDLQEWIQGLQ